ncbi:MAG: diaminopimelate decarboxylase [Acidimicrobiia bacterium]
MSPPISHELLPVAASTMGGRLAIGGCDVVEVAQEFGTPVFVYDEQHLIERCEEAVAAFPDGVAYASKAFLCKAMARIAHDAGMSIDVATGGELYVALEAGVPAADLVFHGNNKSSQELAYALNAGVGRIVVDSFDELDRLDALAAKHPIPPIVLRLNPGISAHTHEYLQTGAEDSKFGISVAGGMAQRAIDRVRSSASMQLAGLHAHIGSQIFDSSSFASAVRALAPFANEADVEELSIGGGLGVAYVAGESAPTISEWGERVRSVAAEAGVTARITAEPGRSIVATAAVTAYSVGTIKTVPGVRTYLAVDGGMSDNARPVLYGSGYEAFLPRNVVANRDLAVRIVGKHCESGDVIVHDARLPSDVGVNDIVCTPVTGAYGHSMGSNYNKITRPPVVFVRDGSARLVVERETYSDLVARDVG